MTRSSAILPALSPLATQFPSSTRRRLDLYLEAIGVDAERHVSLLDSTFRSLDEGRSADAEAALAMLIQEIERLPRHARLASPPDAPRPMIEAVLDLTQDRPRPRAPLDKRVAAAE